MSRFWIDTYELDDVARDEVRTAIYYAFSRHGIEIPWPIEVGYQREWPEPDDAAKQRQREADPGSRRPVRAPRPRHSGSEIASSTAMRTYGNGEPIVRQGDAGDSMFVVASGQVEVVIEPERHRVAGIDAGRLLRRDVAAFRCAADRHGAGASATPPCSSSAPTYSGGSAPRTRRRSSSRGGRGGPARRAGQGPQHVEAGGRAEPTGPSRADAPVPGDRLNVSRAMPAGMALVRRCGGSANQSELAVAALVAFAERVAIDVGILLLGPVFALVVPRALAIPAWRSGSNDRPLRASSRPFRSRRSARSDTPRCRRSGCCRKGPGRRNRDRGRGRVAVAVDAGIAVDILPRHGAAVAISGIPGVRIPVW